jgi:hypothetical protein
MTRPSIERQLSELRKLDMAALRTRYQQLLGEVAPAGVSRDLLESAIGFRLQKQLVAQLRSRMMQALIAGEAIVTALAAASADTILIRKWRGQIHVVTVVDDSVIYQGEEYPSLASVAQIITKGKKSAAALFGESDYRGR